MSGNGHRLIAREGMPMLIALLMLATVAYVFIGPLSALFVFALFLTSIVLFRDPKCVLPSSPLAVLSPASGRIVSIDAIDDPWLSRQSNRIRIQISPWDAHCLRCPTEGKVMNQWSSTEEQKEFDRQYAYWIQTDEGDDVVLVLGMGPAALFTRMTLICGQRAGHGQRCGFLYFAGVIDVYLPANARLGVSVGDRIDSGAGILGQFVHCEGTSAIPAK